MQLTAEAWKGVTDSMNKDGDAPFLLEFRSYINNHIPIHLDKDYAHKERAKTYGRQH